MNNKKFIIEIVTPDGILYSGQAEKFFAPGFEGYFEILFNHTPYMVTLKVGEIKIVSDNKDSFYATSGGFCEIQKNKLIILAETAEKADQIDVSRANAAKERALKRLSEKTKETDISRAELALRRAVNRINIAGKIH